MFKYKVFLCVVVTSFIASVLSCRRKNLRLLIYPFPGSLIGRMYILKAGFQYYPPDRIEQYSFFVFKTISFMENENSMNKISSILKFRSMVFFRCTMHHFISMLY